MKFSVLMSVYKNDNKVFLKQAFESIYENQKLKPDEIVVVLDGPLNEGLYTVIEEFRKKHEEIVKVVRLKENKGLGNALRIGTKYCTHDYIFRMDSDDISDEYRFKKQIDYIKMHPEIDVLGCNISEFKFDHKNEKLSIRAVPQKHIDIIELAKKRNPINHVTVCIKRKSLIDCGGYKTLLLLEDYYLWVRMLIKGYKFENINESLVWVRVGNGFITKRSSNNRIRSLKKLQKYMIENEFITNIEGIRNVLYMKTFLLMPTFLKKIIYKIFLRK
ncbi:glycosyltransferase [Clostridium perfringens]|uniref:Glycosyltransferase n=1 Tax=Clostridium perfringens TaxID=1502 RepID=A0AAW9J1S8_CLOPF|nr:glycosyltransferase [Clostridium perfringens]EJT6498975.1 glycosyltransferase [Clostridium perfringens]EJT6500042.1 glycosyltransferase [Clostridium perfringens]MDZ5032853.1 glycosyltransferase [Clostridium perfringens]